MKMDRPPKSKLAPGILLGLAGCGYGRRDRALSAGLLGTAGGAGIAAATGGTPLVGAAIGGTAGAVAEAVTSEHAVNLGRPNWR